MNCLILAAGYATRLGKLTENFPKPLLPVKDKAILDWLLDDLASTGAIEQFILVSNHRFADNFRNWAAGREESIVVLDDGSTANENRLGAVKDMAFAQRELALQGDLLVIAGDNLLSFSLNGFLQYAQEKRNCCVMRYFEPSEQRLTRCGVISIDATERITEMQEKPAVPKSHWCCPPFYYFTEQAAGLIEKGIAAGCGTDAPGSFIAWLCQQVPVYAMEMPGRRYDIGTLESYQRVQEEF